MLSQADPFIISGMRREWTEAIKNRRWDELERLAKWEPEQQLCDTIAELERGLEGKADRKALRRILWILEKAGVRPTELEESSEQSGTKRAFEAAFMMSADAVGDTPITIGVQRGDRVRWLTAFINESYGVKRASDDSTSLEEAAKRVTAMSDRQNPPYVSAAIDPAFAKFRIRRAIEKNRSGTLPEALAFWRSLLDQAEEVPHPALAIKPDKRKEKTPEEILFLDPTAPWRIELGAANPVLEKMYEAHTSHADKPNDEQSEAVREAIAQARHETVTPGVIQEHHMRLLDLAMLMDATGDETAGRIRAAADRLVKEGADGTYARALVDKTVFIAIERMKQSPPRES